uniref:ribosomal protein S6 n=1 Tax=Pulvinaster venetus TaxID=427767 RepID=UPI001FCE027D|nr:ribosomal protein S6 [Pulvinaster venetus]UNJ17058.1 ribosomal protein S6 [Pulvinaster venetus]
MLKQKIKPMQQLTQYETIYILKPEEKEIYLVCLNIISEYENILKNQGAQNIFTQNRGRRYLAYPINKYNDGIFLQLIFEGNGQIIEILEKDMKFNEKILRHLITRQ